MHLPLGLNQTWNLDAFFPGGSESPAFAAYLDRLQADIAGFAQSAADGEAPQTHAEALTWSGLLETLQEIAKRIRHGFAFISCLSAQNVKDQQARILGGRMKQMAAAYASALTVVDSQMLRIPEPVWQSLLAEEALRPIAGPLEERRRRAREKFAPEAESLVNDLTVDGYHAWGELYDTIVGRMSVSFAAEGKTVSLSMGQTSNRMLSGDRAVRAEAFAKWEEAWAREAELCAAALNHLSGYRLALYKHRGWDSVLREPLETNRMTEQTLQVMWDVIDRNKQPFVAFMARKAELMGLQRLEWHDVSAPLTATTRNVSYGEAANFIVEQFGRFNPELAAFSGEAFRDGWIEAEDRTGKRPGGFCTSFPVAKQSRIFLTFGGNASNVATLAHELGHAYHQHVMNGLPQMAQGYAMNVAETASTFAELIMSDAAVREAGSDLERIALLADKCERAIAFFMNIHARFLFETSFYAQRKRGMLSVERLSELMAGAQRAAYKESLGSYHPHFWASKLHFYITGQPFYNFPYTFGFLFSAGVYARALAEGPAFAPKYDALLCDTGRMRVEELAQRHLGVDLTGPEFWQSAVDLSIADVNRFLELTSVAARGRT